MMKSSILTAAVIAPVSVLAVAPAAFAAYNSVTGTSYTYTQDFNGLPGTSGAWANDATLPGWFAYSGTSTTPTALNYATSAGGTATGQMYSFGSSASVNGASDRALGSINQTATGDIRFGTVFVNNTGETITSFTVGYEGEQWRVATDQDQAQSLNAQYRIFDSGTGSIAPAGFTSLGINFASPKVNTNPGAAAALDGNLAENRVSGLTTTTAVTWLPGQELWVRFFDTDSSGVDHGLSVDNFTFAAAVPEPAAALTVMGLGLWLTRRRPR
jgi:hypothetical protein